MNSVQSGLSVCRTGNGKKHETKQQPGKAGPDNILGCCLVSPHFLCDIHSIHSVHDKGEGVKNSEIFAEVIYGRPLSRRMARALNCRMDPKHGHKTDSRLDLFSLSLFLCSRSEKEGSLPLQNKIKWQATQRTVGGDLRLKAKMINLSRKLTFPVIPAS